MRLLAPRPGLFRSFHRVSFFLTVLAALAPLASAQDKTDPIVTLRGHSAFIHCVVFSPDGTQVATASDDKTVKIWDSATGKDVHTLRGHTSLVLSVSFSPDGTRLASAGDDKTVRLWDTSAG